VDNTARQGVQNMHDDLKAPHKNRVD